MSGLLTVVIEYDKETPRMDGRKVLRAAKDSLALLHAIDREMRKGKRRKAVRWDVNIYSFSDRAVIEFSPIDGEPVSRTLLGEEFAKRWAR